MKWIWFLNWKATEEFRREDYYLAQIAADVTRGQVKNRSSVTLQRKLLKFSKRKRRAQSVDDMIYTSKTYWRSVAGIEGRKRKWKVRKPPKQKEES